MRSRSETALGLSGLFSAALVFILFAFFHVLVDMYSCHILNHRLKTVSGVFVLRLWYFHWVDIRKRDQVPCWFLLSFYHIFFVLWTFILSRTIALISDPNCKKSYHKRHPQCFLVVFALQLTTGNFQKILKSETLPWFSKLQVVN